MFIMETLLINNSPRPVLVIPPKCRYKQIHTIVFASYLENTLGELKQLSTIAKALRASGEALYLQTGENEQGNRLRLIVQSKRRAIRISKLWQKRKSTN